VSGIRQTRNCGRRATGIAATVHKARFKAPHVSCTIFGGAGFGDGNKTCADTATEATSDTSPVALRSRFLPHRSNLDLELSCACDLHGATLLFTRGYLP